MGSSQPRWAPLIRTARPGQRPAPTVATGALIATHTNSMMFASLALSAWRALSRLTTSLGPIGRRKYTSNHSWINQAPECCLKDCLWFYRNCSIAGAWLGYSVNASLIDNDLSDSPAGVSDQSAVNISLIGNRILRNGVGVLTNTGTFPPTALFTGGRYTSNQSWINQAPKWLGSIKRRNAFLKARLLVVAASRGYQLTGNIIANSTGIGLDFLDTGNVFTPLVTICPNSH